MLLIQICLLPGRSQTQACGSRFSLIAWITDSESGPKLTVFIILRKKGTKLNAVVPDSSWFEVFDVSHPNFKR